MFEWARSIRAISVIVFVSGLTIGLFLRIVPIEIYSQAAMLVIGAYFAKRDTPQERGD
jgi:hypothetical protein